LLKEDEAAETTVNDKFKRYLVEYMSNNENIQKLLFF
tara:strand:- start:215 stop:325 length:111 start_codon:yes stop_codon:yes gene_type:complete